MHHWRSGYFDLPPSLSGHDVVQWARHDPSPTMPSWPNITASLGLEGHRQIQLKITEGDDKPGKRARWSSMPWGRSRYIIIVYSKTCLYKSMNSPSFLYSISTNAPLLILLCYCRPDDRRQVATGKAYDHGLTSQSRVNLVCISLHAGYIWIHTTQLRHLAKWHMIRIRHKGSLFRYSSWSPSVERTFSVKETCNSKRIFCKQTGSWDFYIARELFTLKWTTCYWITDEAELKLWLPRWCSASFTHSRTSQKIVNSEYILMYPSGISFILPIWLRITSTWCPLSLGQGVTHFSFTLSLWVVTT